MASVPPPKLIVIADDYEEAAALLASLVQVATPHTALVARNGIEALEQATLYEAEVCILDMQMPVMDGLTAALELHRRLGARRPRLLAMSGRGSSLDEARSSGLFDLVLLKPVDMDELLAFLNLP